MNKLSLMILMLISFLAFHVVKIHLQNRNQPFLIFKVKMVLLAQLMGQMLLFLFL